MTAAVEIPQIDYRRVEQAYRMTKDWRFHGHDNFARAGMRAANAGDPKLLKALDKAAEVMMAEYEKQLGETQRRSSVDFSERTIPTEVQMYREAYICMDRGTPSENLQWIYAAGAWLAGLI